VFSVKARRKINHAFQKKAILFDRGFGLLAALEISVEHTLPDGHGQV
jgi:hypothetical protein